MEAAAAATVIAFPRGGGARPAKKQNSNNSNNKEDEKAEASSYKNRERPSDIKKKRKAAAAAEQDGAAAAAAAPDFLFGTKHSTDKDNKDKSSKQGNKKHKAENSTSSSSKHSLLPLGGGGVVIPAINNSHSHNKKHTGIATATATATTAGAPIIEALSFAKLTKGTKVLGTVREVQDEFAVISLPNLLTGYMLLPPLPPPLPNANTAVVVQSLQQCLQVGQVMTVVVQKVATEQMPGGSNNNTKRRIQVSALPTHVNPRDTSSPMNAMASSTIRGQILSVEDHGCLVDLGMGRQGFLKFDQVEGEYILLEDGDTTTTTTTTTTIPIAGNVDTTVATAVTDDDEEEQDDDNDGNGKKKKQKKKQQKKKNKATDKPRILQPGRLYDFMPAAATATMSSTNDKSSTTTTVIPLTLPLTSTVAQQILLPQATASSRHASGATTTPYSLASLQPGMMVTAKVEALAKNGLCVTFLGNVFRGALEFGSHLGGADFVVTNATTTSSSSGTTTGTTIDTAWRKVFDHHQHFPARIIAIDVPTKLIRLSIAPHVLNLVPPPISMMTTPLSKDDKKDNDKNKDKNKATTTSSSSSPFVVGKILQDCTVVRVDQGIGALLALPAEYHHTTSSSSLSLLPKRMMTKSDLFSNNAFQHAMNTPTVYVHISKAYDDPSTTFNTTNTGSSSSKKKKQQASNKNNDHHEVNVGHFAKDFSLGSKHDVRILNTGHWMDGVASGGCAPSILKAHVLTHADLQPGQLYKQVPVCAQLKGGSILVNLGGSPGNPVRGLIPSPLHLMDNNNSIKSGASSDFRKKVLETKFAVDAKVDVRVLTVDHVHKKCIVTAKKSLVKVDGSGDESSERIVTSYQNLKVGQMAVGFVSKLDDRAVYVTFCNGVYGKVTAKSLAAELGIENHREAYPVGDVVTCRVVKISKTHKNNHHHDDDDDGDNNDDDDDDEEGDDIEAADEMEVDSPEGDDERAFYQVLLSLKVQNMDDTAMDEDDEEDIEAKKTQLGNAEAKQVHVKAGAILPEKSIKILELFKGKRRGKHFVPGYAIVSIKSKYLLDESEQSSMLPQMECKLPFDQLLDDYEAEDIESPEALDAMAARVMRVGKKINQKAIVLSDPHKSNIDHSSGIGKLTVVSLRKSLIATMEGSPTTMQEDDSILLPSPSTNLFVGALVKGYIAQIDPRHGAFLRFLDGMTGLIPRMNGGLDLTPYSTIVAKVQVIDDTVRPFRIMLQPLTGSNKSQGELPFKVGDTISKATVKGIQFLEMILEILDDGAPELKNVRVRIHATMKEAEEAKLRLRKSPPQKGHFVKGHPFFGHKVGEILSDLTVVWVGRKKGVVTVQVTDRKEIVPLRDDSSTASTFVSKRSELKPGMTVGAVVTEVHGDNKGLQVMVSPLVTGYIPGLELSPHLGLLNSMTTHVPLGAKLKCVVMDDSQWHENRAKSPFASRTQKSWSDRKSTPEEKRALFLSVIAVTEPTLAMEKPSRNDLIIGRVNKKLPQYQGPSLMLALRGGFVARCCITETAEPDEWENMPLGRMTKQPEAEKPAKKNKKDAMEVDEEEESDDSSSDNSGDETKVDKVEIEDSFPDGKYFRCRVLKSVPKQSLVEVSLRTSRLEGDLDDDETPPEGETVQGYVVETNKKGCFVRLARHIEGRATLTELCDGFLPNPTASFPPGRLVVGKIKSIGPIQKKSKNSKSPARFQANLDMRETSLLDSQKALCFEDIEVQGKYKGTVTRVESYGVFVQIENSKVSGLVHLSECSDSFVKNLGALYDPGDPVKVLVIKKDEAEKKIGFSMKASHFEDDDDSDDDSSIEDEEALLDDDGIDSDDENFASKLAAKMENDDGDDDDGDDKDDEDEDDKSEDPNGDSSDSTSDSEEEEEEEEEENPTSALDANIGFDWAFKGTASEIKKAKMEGDSSDESDSSDSESDEEAEDDENAGKGTSHKSRKKQAQRRREEQEISKREIALADGTADENPETPGDFERLLAGNPNSSELWIRYMAFYLSLADIPAARLVADKALDRIEFREEREKLNVWTAVLTLEHKYGSEDSLRRAIDRACGQNSPKQVYLRVCEILEKDLSTPGSVSQADAMYSKMCSKFKSKKTVWLAHLSYLIKQSRHEEAHALLKRALLSLATYKHAEIMSKFAQLEFEYGSPERARTLFDGLTTKYPKRLDLFFVYVDKEVKFGSFQTARTLLESKVDQGKLTDKQVKGLFKKWYRLEEQHGTEESVEHVKESARQYVQKSSE